MKKTYCKPELTFESFELSQSVAAGCEFISNHVKGSCALDLGIVTLFTQELFKQHVCGTTPAPGQDDSFCYDVPSDDKNVFSS